MGFWEDTLSSSIGSFIGIGGAYAVAKWQLGKTQKQTNTQFYVNFNEAQIYINQYTEDMDMIINLSQTVLRSYARRTLSRDMFCNLRDNLFMSIQVTNPLINENEIEDFSITLLKINQHAPLSLYKEMNDLFFWMGIIYNALLKDCENLVSDMPKRVDIAFSDDFPIDIAVKRFRKKYKKLKKDLKI